MKYDINVAESDFATEGTFCARLSNIWTTERAKNPNFGQAKGKSEICLRDVEYVHDAICNGILFLFAELHHLNLIMEFILLCHFALSLIIQIYF